MIRLLRGWSLMVLLAAPALAEDAKAPPKGEMTADETKLIELINAERKKAKLPPLRPHPVLSKVARAHSANMARQQKMEHVLNGKNPGERVLAAKYDYGKISENIAMSDGPGVPLDMIVKGWMDSKTHRENLLSDKVTETGLGIATNKEGEVYYTQLFARPRKTIDPRD